MEDMQAAKSVQLVLALESSQREDETPAEVAEQMEALQQRLREGGGSAEALAAELKLILGVKLSLVVHDNRSTMVSFRREPEGIDLRVHRMFLAADAHTVTALAEYARTGSEQAGRALDVFIGAHQDAVRAHDPSTLRAPASKGAFHDLKPLFDELNAAYFEGTVSAVVGWGRGATSARRRRVRLGTYFEKTRTILIHPLLDAPEVPQMFVAFIVYHEMLHQAVPAQRSAAGRRSVHPPEFRRRERLFAQYAEARSWERRHLPAMLNPPAPVLENES